MLEDYAPMYIDILQQVLLMAEWWTTPDIKNFEYPQP